MRLQKTYYSVYPLPDGIITLAVDNRKPRKSRHTPYPKIDQDGIFRWRVERQEEYIDTDRVVKLARSSTIATCMRMRRIVRDQVETRLNRIESQLQSMQAQLNRIEQAIG